MKRSTKSTLIAALIVFTLGVLLATVSFVVALSLEVDIYDDEGRNYNFASTHYTLSDLRTQGGLSESQSISELNVDLQVAHVRLQLTDGETQIELHNADLENLSIGYHTGVLTLEETNAVNRFGFAIDQGEISFGGLRHLFHSVSNRPLAEIVILWNPVDEISAFRLGLTCGTISVDGLPDTAALHTSLTFGSVDIRNCTAPEQTATASVTAGSITSENNLFSALACKATCATFSLLHTDCAVNANVAFGRIRCVTSSENANCLLRANTTFGSVFLPNGENVGSQYNSPAQNTAYTAQLTLTVGNVFLENSSSS